MGPQASLQLSTQSGDPGVWMRVTAEAFEQMEDRGLRENRVGQIDKGEQVLFEQCWKQAHQGFTRISEGKNGCEVEAQVCDMIWQHMSTVMVVLKQLVDQSIDRKIISNYKNQLILSVIFQEKIVKHCQIFADFCLSNKGICCFPLPYINVNMSTRFWGFWTFGG